MSYASLDQLTERFGEKMLIQLTDRATPAAGAIDADVVARSLADTAAQIDGYLARRYRLPLAETPTSVTDLALTIAIYKLHRRNPDDKIKKDYDDALKALRDIAAGIIMLAVEGVEPPASSTSDVRVSDRDRVMTTDSMKGFV